jgi:hypothetical protein
MPREAVALAFLVTALLGSGCATPQAAPPSGGEPQSGERDCFNQSMVHGFSLIDDHTVDVSVGANRHYILTTSWNAHDLNWSEAIELRSTTGWICTGNGLGVEVRGGHPRMTYPITGVARAPEPAPSEHHN